ncbi:MAG TPA: glycosyltransferase family 39 protein [Pseudobacteroides sp.]|uniref:ArnT family glycosyltransferase n=1 Tax=Pseudobacteroides sp. TaxID=1968840 RepID=UPI002F9549E3
MQTSTAYNTNKIKDKWCQFICLAVVCLFIGISSAMSGTAMAGLLIVLSSIVFIATGLLKKRESGLVIILGIALITRVALAVTNSFIFSLPDNETDAVVFEGLGWDIANAWNHGTVPPDTPGAYLYSKFIALVYLFTGRSPFIIQYFNVFFGFISVYFVYKLIIEIGGSKRSATIGCFIAAIFPTLNLYSAVILRENLITVMSLISVYFFIRWLNTGFLSRIILAVFFLGGAASVHGAVILVGVIYLIYFCFYKPKVNEWRPINKEALIAIALTVIVFVFFRARLLNKLPSDITLVFSPDYLTSRLVPLAVGRAAYLVGYYPTSIMDIIIQTPVRILHFILMPFPWKITAASDIIGCIDAVMYGVFIFFSFKGLRKAEGRDRLLFIALICIILLEVFTFAWGTSNFGTAIRHRQKFVCLLIATASIGMSGYEKKQKS